LLPRSGFVQGVIQSGGGFLAWPGHIRTFRKIAVLKGRRFYSAAATNTFTELQGNSSPDSHPLRSGPGAFGHKLPAGYRGLKMSVLGGLHHDYSLVKEAA